MLVLQNDIAQAIAAGVRIKLGRDRPAPSRTRSLNPAAYDPYLRGRYFSKTLREKRLSFEQAIRLDPDYAAGYAALAQSYLYSNVASAEAGSQGQGGSATRSRARRDLPAAHLASRQDSARRSMGLGGREAALSGARSSSTRMDGDALMYYARLHISLGRFSEAIAVRKRAAELSPADLETPRTSNSPTTWLVRRSARPAPDPRQRSW